MTSRKTYTRLFREQFVEIWYRTRNEVTFVEHCERLGVSPRQSDGVPLAHGSTIHGSRFAANRFVRAFWNATARVPFWPWGGAGGPTLDTCHRSRAANRFSWLEDTSVLAREELQWLLR